MRREVAECTFRNRLCQALDVRELPAEDPALVVPAPYQHQ